MLFSRKKRFLSSKLAFHPIQTQESPYRSAHGLRLLFPSISTKAMATNAASHDDDCSVGSAVTPDAESLLQEEMMKLSLEDRNKFQEEIHGVQSLAKEESPEFLRESLRQLDFELKNNNIPLRDRKAYLKSQELFANKNKQTYVNTDEFRLRFLRCSLFDIPNAARHVNRFLLVVSKYFGDYALQRPIRISDFSKEELRELRKGRYQFLPFRDRAGARGRRILTVFPDEEWGKFSHDLRAKIWLYLCYAAGEDIEVQKNGMVVIVWFDNAWDSVTRAHFVGMGGHEKAFGVRLSSVHICTPDTPKSRFRRAMMIARVGAYTPQVKINVGTYQIVCSNCCDRCFVVSILCCLQCFRIFVLNLNRLSSRRLGKSVELMYTLQSYGIPVEYIPISFTGKVKEKCIKEWMRLRQLIEDDRLNRNWTAESNSNMIESPYLDDIIFRNGTKLLSHPGNIALRSVIVEMCMLEENKLKNTKDLVVLIISEMKGCNGGSNCSRFLNWNEKGWWKQVTPENEPKEIHTKISRIVRDTRKLLREQQEAQATSNSDSMPEELDEQSRGTYIFLSDGQKRQKLSRDCF